MLSERAAFRFLLAMAAVVLCGAAVTFVLFVVITVVELLSLLGRHNWESPRVFEERYAVVADLVLCVGFGIAMTFWSWGGLLGCALK
jgi:hypothetical protein